VKCTRALSIAHECGVQAALSVRVDQAGVDAALKQLLRKRQYLFDTDSWYSIADLYRLTHGDLLTRLERTAAALKKL
jgi:hypothetical protein